MIMVGQMIKVSFFRKGIINSIIRMSSINYYRLFKIPKREILHGNLRATYSINYDANL